MQGNCCRFQTCFANTVCILSGTLIPVAAYPLVPSVYLTLTEDRKSEVATNSSRVDAKRGNTSYYLPLNQVKLLMS
jgi:hypothetical protein